MSAFVSSDSLQKGLQLLVVGFAAFPLPLCARDLHAGRGNIMVRATLVSWFLVYFILCRSLKGKGPSSLLLGFVNRALTVLKGRRAPLSLSINIQPYGVMK